MPCGQIIFCLWCIFVGVLCFDLSLFRQFCARVGGSLAEFHRKPWMGVKFHNGILNDSSPNCSAVFWLLYLAIIVLLFRLADF